MVQRREREHDFCPRCRLPRETSNHIITCKAAGATTQWKKSLTSLKEQLQNTSCPTDLPEGIIQCLDAWREGVLTIDISHCSPITKQLLRAQQQIGWKHFLDGCIHQLWTEILADKQKTKRWVTALIKKLWTVSWEMWDHRNQALHRLENNDTLLGWETTKAEVREELETGVDPLMTRDKKALFTLKTDELQEWTLDKAQVWLSSVQAARKACITRNQLYMGQERRLMMKWLGK